MISSIFISANLIIYRLISLLHMPGMSVQEDFLQSTEQIAEKASKTISLLLWTIVLGIVAIVILFVIMKILNAMRYGNMKSTTEEDLDKARKSEAKGDFLAAAAQYQELNDLKKAVALFEKGKDFGRAAEICEELEHYEKSIALYKKAGESLKAAELCIKSGKYFDAATIFKNKGDRFRAAQALELFGNKFAAAREYAEAKHYLKAAKLFHEEQMYAEAAEMYLMSFEGKELSESTLDKYYAYASFLVLASDMDRAADIYTGIISIDPDYRDVRSKLGTLGLHGDMQTQAELAATGEEQPEQAMPAQPEHALPSALEQAVPAEPESAIPSQPELDLTPEPEPALTPEPEQAMPAQPEQAVPAEPEPALTPEPEPVALAEPMRTTSETTDSSVKIRMRVEDKLEEEMADEISALIQNHTDEEEDAVVAAGGDQVKVDDLFEGLEDKEMKAIMANAREDLQTEIDDLFSLHSESLSEEESLKMESTLRSILKSGKLDPKYCMRMWVQILKNLDDKHKENVFYGNLPPESIHIDMQNNIRFDDPGAGFSDYIAPEIVSGLPPDQQSDIYPVGLILYEMLTGGLATHADKKPSEVVDDIPEWLDELTMKCIAEEREDRYASLSEISGILATLRR
jgi:tetratricopeptide (TPR) repeat protein